MKKYIVAYCFLVSLIWLTGCSNNVSAGNSPNPSPSSRETNDPSVSPQHTPVDSESPSPSPSVETNSKDAWQGLISLDDLELVGAVYVEPLYTGIWDYSWRNVSEIKADDLLMTCCKANYLELLKIQSRDFYINPFWPSDSIEWSIQKHFDVPSDYLKTSSFYNAQNDIYQVSGSDSEEYKAVAVSAEQKGKQIIVEVGIVHSDPSYKPFPGDIKVSDGYSQKKGILTIEQVYGKQVKYLSFEAYNSKISELLTELSESPLPSQKVNDENIDEWQGPINLENLQAVGAAYVRPFDMNVWQYSWSNVSEIKANDLFDTCCRANYLNLLTDFEGVYLSQTAPANRVEWEIQKHFDVSSISSTN